MWIKALASGPKPVTPNARVSLVLLCCQAIRNLIPQKCWGGGIGDLSGWKDVTYYNHITTSGDCMIYIYMYI